MSYEKSGKKSKKQIANFYKPVYRFIFFHWSIFRHCLKLANQKKDWLTGSQIMFIQMKDLIIYPAFMLQGKKNFKCHNYALKMWKIILFCLFMFVDGKDA